MVVATMFVNGVPGVILVFVFPNIGGRRGLGLGTEREFMSH